MCMRRIDDDDRSHRLKEQRSMHVDLNEGRSTGSQAKCHAAVSGTLAAEYGKCLTMVEAPQPTSGKVMALVQRMSSCRWKNISLSRHRIGALSWQFPQHLRVLDSRAAQGNLARSTRQPRYLSRILAVSCVCAKLGGRKVTSSLPHRIHTIRKRSSIVDN